MDSNINVFRDYNSSVLEILIKAGAKTSLLDEVYYVNPKTVKLLLAGCDNLDTQNVFHKLINGTVDYEVTINRVKEVVELLTEYGADINQPDARGITPLFYTIGTDLSILQVFIDLGANVNEIDSRGEHLLHKCIDNIDMIRLLLDNGADINVGNRYLDTPLHLSVYDHEVVQLLVDYGAKSLVNLYGETPLDIAIRNSCTLSIEILTRAQNARFKR